MNTRKVFVQVAGLVLTTTFGFGGAAAQDDIVEAMGEAVGGAVSEGIAAGEVNADCIAGAVADRAVTEGVRKGRKLLGRLGIGAPAAPAAEPCGGAAASSAPAASAAATAQEAAAVQAADPRPVAVSAGARASSAAPAADTGGQRRGLFGNLGQRTQGNAPARSRGRDCGALGAGCADGLQPLVDCVNQKTFWGEMANAVEQKRATAAGLTAGQLADMDADIAAMRAAHAVNAGQVEPVDPAQPNRHLDWLTPDEYSQAATAAGQALTAHRQMCNQRHTGF